MRAPTFVFSFYSLLLIATCRLCIIYMMEKIIPVYKVISTLLTWT